MKRLPLTRLVRFRTGGLTGVGVDMVVLNLLSDPTPLGPGLTRSKIFAAEAAILNNFVWNDHWTYRGLARDQLDAAAWFRRFVKCPTPSAEPDSSSTWSS